MEQWLWTLASSSVGFRGQIRIIWPSLCLLTPDRQPVSFLFLPLHLMGQVSMGSFGRTTSVKGSGLTSRHFLPKIHCWCQPKTHQSIRWSCGLEKLLQGAHHTAEWAVNGHKMDFKKIVKCFYEVFTKILFSAASSDSLEAEIEWPGKPSKGKSPFLWHLFLGWGEAAALILRLWRLIKKSICANKVKGIKVIPLNLPHEVEKGLSTLTG